MASSNEPSVNQRGSRLLQSLEPIWSPLFRAISFATSSFFRFMILFGIVLLVIGATMVDGHVSGHLGVYGGTAIFVGVLGRAIAHWKLKDA